MTREGALMLADALAGKGVVGSVGGGTDVAEDEEVVVVGSQILPA